VADVTFRVDSLNRDRGLCFQVRYLGIAAAFYSANLSYKSNEYLFYFIADTGITFHTPLLPELDIFCTLSPRDM
jgi:hypothetical protein